MRILGVSKVSGRPWPLDGSFSARSLLPYGLLLIALSAIIATIWSSVISRIDYERRVTIARAWTSADKAVNTFEQFVLRTLDEADVLTRVMSVTLHYNRPDIAIAKAKETGILDGSVFESINIEDENGDLLATSLGEAPRLNYFDRQYFQRAAHETTNALIIGKPIHSRLTKSLTIPIARRIANPDGSFGGLILLQLNAAAFAQGYRNFAATDRDFMLLADLDAMVLAGQTGQEDLTGSQLSAPKTPGVSQKLARRSSACKGIYGQRRTFCFV